MYASIIILSLVGSPALVGQPPIGPPSRPKTEILLPEGPSLPPLPPPGAIPIPAPASKIPTHREFAKIFRPMPGVHEVTIIHPITGKPVDLSFRLPEGNPKRVHVLPRTIVFEYSNKEVSLIFRLFGQADVRYN